MNIGPKKFNTIWMKSIKNMGFSSKFETINIHIIFRSFLQIAMRQYFFNLNFVFIENYYFAFE